MNRFVVPAAAVCLSAFCLSAIAQQVTPLKGQSPETTQQDIAACQAQAQAQAGIATAGTPNAGGRARGAAAGAAAGAAVAGARGRQHEEVYDRMDDDTKQAYRQNQAKDAAAAGMVVGGSRQRQERREDRANAPQQDAAVSSAYANCMQQRGYQVTP
ncbi:YMGG-like glycine zipper-containing protein [Achromobacter sp. MFA1 R4]|uniref:YMGG-like glycine zipper-containing protein n=1 Tax=Achromobacter sp. MFA1 R4 TaxID=1881016 RepID=UPI00095387AB|nr:YMGG-like glycine zipper-containing protein [Achromobacter sp. MFA1 R4]SIT30540.1 YMGG-like Gly-zipper [Achromobacter sp. MFA1 R4]